MQTHGGLPRVSREQVLAAVAVLEQTGPVSIGQIALRVAGDLGVDMSKVHTAYELRKLISWGRLQTELKHLGASGELVRRTEEEWQRVGRGLLFDGACSGTTWRYATPDGARAVRGLARGDEDAVRHVLARQWAAQQLTERYPVEYAALVDEWIARHEHRKQHTIAVAT